ncbi:DUF262 domain-containing protein [Arcicella rigui]|uniref:DUF262 domain-containing HNH endonuclease family protein n=1 Tax=Arcicella rigui TaxID=797020 RepID=A0ABU5QAR6_9BACT|nr:DUF262 domain-containing HNH endonuclease family protein [Arcicella rigui]MEA5139935.1 DUF262 domain-containing HNH endonuclease family protein [Arcicella rigui]
MKGIQDTSSKTYRQLMGNGLRYEIPKFQRDYTWEAEQWDDLWQDIKSLLTNEETEHYMGYLVLQTSNNKNFLIIDGQQRLTTLSILILATLKCLKDLVESGVDAEKNHRRKENLQNSYIGYVDPVTLISNNKLKLNRNSEDYYKQHLVLLRDLPLRNTNSSEKHMRECLMWYYDKIKKDFKTGEELAAFIDNIVDKLFFTVIEVTDQINAFKVFETLNARGVQLSSSDLLKNYLFSVVDETNPHISEIEELENIWNSIVGKLGEQKFEDYLRYYWNSENKTVGKKNLFKSIKTNISTKEKVFALVRNLRDTADIYIAIQNPDDVTWNTNIEIRESLRELKLFQIRQTNSLLMAGYKNLDTSAFKKLVRTCSIISFRYNIIGGLNPNAQEEVYNSIALKINANKQFSVQDFQPIYISDINFENDFSTKEFKNTSRNHKIIKYILSKIEAYKYQNEISPESDLYTIEHILPESADESWGMSQESINRSVYRIGNLTLLEKKLNKGADVLRYSDKVNFFNKSNSRITNSLSENYESWSEEKISARQRDLAKDAKSIWRIQELDSKK